VAECDKQRSKLVFAVDLKVRPLTELEFRRVDNIALKLDNFLLGNGIHQVSNYIIRQFKQLTLLLSV